MAFDPTSTLLATGSSDSTIKLWDVVRQYCTHNLKGSRGVVSLVQFHPDPERLHLFSVSDDNHIRVWDLQTSSCLSVLESHYGAVTGLAFTGDGQTLLSSGRDSVVVIWDLVKREAKKTIPVFEPLEAVIVLPEGDFPILTAKRDEKGPTFITAGAKGILKVWTSSGRCLFEQKGSPLELTRRQAHQAPEDQDDLAVVTGAMLCPETNSIVVVTYDHNILFFGMEELKMKKQFVGYNEEILDLKLMGKNESHLAVASNSEQIRVFDLTSGGCQILTGHTDIILALDVFKKGLKLISSSKDNTVRVWQMDAATHLVSCLAVGAGHTHSVGAVAAARLSSKFCVSGSEDCTLKVWKIPEHASTDEISKPVHMKVSFTEKAHDKDINSVCLSPNDKLLATGSQDKVAKLWHMEKEVLLGSFRGHRRGIWCVQFSPTDQALATSSADGTIKIWALSDFSCVKTFEGHDASVLKVIFLTRGMQLFSSGSDGLLKLWTIKSNECVKTLDEHEDKVWSVIADRAEKRLVTAGADSSILIWEDVTQIELEEQAEKEEDQILKEQELSNLLQSKKFTKALGLAITLDQPFKALGIIKTILEGARGLDQLERTMGKLRADQIAAILKFAQVWNTNSKHCHVAQSVVAIVLRSNDPDDLAKFPGMRTILEGLIPYTERHYQRLSRLTQQAMFVQYTWQVMRRATESSGGHLEETPSHRRNIEDKLLATLPPDDDTRIGDFFLDKSGVTDRIRDSKDNEEKSDEDEDEEMEEEKDEEENDDDDDEEEEEAEEEEAEEEEEEKKIRRRTSKHVTPAKSVEPVRMRSRKVADKEMDEGGEEENGDDSENRTSKGKTSAESSKQVSTETKEAEDEDLDPSDEDGSEDEPPVNAAQNPIPLSSLDSDEDDEDKDEDDDGDGDDGGGEDGGDGAHNTREDTTSPKSRKPTGRVSSRTRSKHSLKSPRENPKGDARHSDPTSKVKKAIRAGKEKTPAHSGRASKRKASAKATPASEKVARKSTPSPYGNKLRSRKKVSSKP
ncbi:transducin beta-like protein 3 [Diadema setosum]|uniref:transducin beta-like protein 3 n=1 Tax=Diadema setosum TaxID=31175 RepID=UPI003B3B159B